MTKTKARVVVAMSGGVDSSVAAALLEQQGYEVIGMMMRLWSEPGKEAYNRCCTPDAMALARRVAAKLSIPFYAVNAQDYFHDTVVDYFVDGYSRGLTPNPCVVCNRQVRWEFLLNRALSFGAAFMATGHYARVDCVEPPGEYILSRAVDRTKDQSYVLHVLGQQQLAHALFPLGGYTKVEVRQLARDFDLPVADRADSQDLCFLGNGDYRDFLARNAPEVSNPGPIFSSSGERLGEHRGLAFYTIGQRKGLGIAAPHPLYVLDKNRSRNALIVGPSDELGTSELTAAQVNWTSGRPPAATIRAQVMIRYKAHLVNALVTPQGLEGVHVRFDEPLRDITPGQAAVFYQDERVLGGGIIQE